MADYEQSRMIESLRDVDERVKFMRHQKSSTSHDYKILKLTLERKSNDFSKFYQFQSFEQIENQHEMNLIKIRETETLSYLNQGEVEKVSPSQNNRRNSKKMKNEVQLKMGSSNFDQNGLPGIQLFYRSPQLADLKSIPLRVNYDVSHHNYDLLGLPEFDHKEVRTGLSQVGREEGYSSQRKSARRGQKTLIDKKGEEALEDIHKYPNQKKRETPKIVKTFEINGKNYYFGENSLNYFSKVHPFRLLCAKIYASVYWKLIIVAFTIINIVGYDRVNFATRLHLENQDEKDSMKFEIPCAVFFTLEFFINVITMGFYAEPRTYLRDGYNVLSLLVLIAEWIYIAIAAGSDFHTFISVVRVFRPLTLIQISPQLSLYFTALLKTIPQLQGLFMSLVAIMIFYAILGLHIFMGAEDHRCRIGDHPEPDGEFPIAEDFQPSLCGNYDCPAGSSCKSLKDYGLPRRWEETDEEIFNYGFTTFDNIGWSMFTIYHVTRAIGWTSITFMYGRYLNRGIVVVYFVSLLLLTFFILVNMLLGELYEGYIEHFEQLKLEDPNLRKEHGEKSTTVVTKVKIQDLQNKLQERDKTISQNGNNLVTLRNKEKIKMSKVQNLEDSENPGITTTTIRLIKSKVESLKLEKNFSTFKAYLVLFVHSEAFHYISSIITICQAIVLCSDRADMKQSEEKTLKRAEFVFFWIYCLEFTARFAGMGWKQFFYFENQEKQPSTAQGIPSIAQNNNNLDKEEENKKTEEEEQLRLEKINQKNGIRFFNRMDAVIIVLNLIEYLIRLGKGEHLVYDFTTYGKIVCVTKCFRIFRVLYFSTSLQPLNYMIEAFARTISEVVPYVYIIVIVAIIFSLIGYQLFSFRMRFVVEEFPKIAKGEDLANNSESERINFDSFFASFVAATNFMLNEEWHLTMYNLMRTYSRASVVYWIVITLAGELILVRFLLAFYINKLIVKLKESKTIGEENSEEGEELNTDQNNEKILQELRLKDQIQESIGDDDSALVKPIELIGNGNNQKMMIEMNQEKVQLITEGGKKDEVQANRSIDRSSQQNQRQQQQKKNEEREAQYQRELQKILQEQEEKRTPFQRVQRYIDRKILRAAWFENTIIVLITATTILMAMDSPLDDPSSSFRYTVLMIDNVITAIYAIECVLKVICQGFVLNEGAYLRDFWNFLDFGSLVIAIQSIFLQNNLYVFKVVRAFKILKLTKRFEGLNLVLVSLGRSKSLILKLFIFAFSYLICYGLLAVKFLKGSYRKCVNLDESIAEEVLTREECYDFGGDWIKADFHYDNIVASVYNLFIIATCEGWNFFQFDIWDYIAVDKQPHRDHSFTWTFYITIHFFVGNLMVFNTFIGVLIEQFAAIKESLSKYKGMKEDEKEWEMIKDGIIEAKPVKKLVSPYDKNFFETEEDHKERKKNIVEWRWKLYEWIYSTPEKWKNFNRVMDFFIILNSIIFMLHYDRMPDSWATWLRWANNILVIIFFFEIVTKIYLFRNIFFQEIWNCFEIFLLITALIAMIWQESSPETLLEHIYIRIFLRLFQVFRVLRLIKSFEFLEKTFASLFYVMPKVSGVGAVFLMTLYVFALFGYSLFPYIRTQSRANGVDLHFRSFSGSIISLIRVASGELWFQLVGDIQREMGPHFVCQDIKNYDDYAQYGLYGCGNVVVARIFFFIFHLCVGVIILNLLIAMILSSSLEYIKLQKQAVKTFQLNKITDLWQEYDPQAIGFIGYKEFWTFAVRMAMIYGVEQKEFLDLENKKKFMIALAIPIYESQQLKLFGYKFHDVILKMTALSIFIKKETYKEAKDTPNTNPLFTKTDFFSGDMAYIILMQRKIKAWCKRTQEKKLQDQNLNPVQIEKAKQN